MIDRDTLIYGFGHLVGSHGTDAHAGDSGDLALEVLESLGLTARQIEILDMVAEHVADNYEYTGTGVAVRRKIEAGEM